MICDEQDPSRSCPLGEDVMDRVPDLVYRYRVRPVPGFEYVSPSATAITGYSPADHYADPELGRRIVHPDDLGILDEVARNPDESRVYRMRWRRRDGHEFVTEQRLQRILDAEGTLVAIVGVCRPVFAPASRWTVDAGSVRVDLVSGRAFVGSRPLTLTASEHRLLTLLAVRGATVSRRELVEHLWGEYHPSGERAVEVHISHLREKLERDPRRPELLLTERGRGYRLAG
jgi:PAS domain S-box-containing protein